MYRYSGSVKTVERCKMKARLEYSQSKEHEWPYTRNIIDLVRCSVVFDNIKDLLAGIDQFKRIIDANENDTCIKLIYRIKNGFENLKNISNLDDYVYCDVKFNVLIDLNGNSIIGEIQFLAKFMVSKLKYFFF